MMKKRDIRVDVPLDFYCVVCYIFSILQDE